MTSQPPVMAPEILRRRFFAVASLAPQAGGKRDKAPRTPATLALAETNDVDTLGTYDEALAAVAAGRAPICGPVLKRDGVICIDLDSALVSETGEITEGALWVLQMFPGSLVTRSVSGAGLHIWIKAKAPPGMNQACANLYTEPKNQGQRVEILIEKFVAERWDIFSDGDILPAQEALNHLYAELKKLTTPQVPAVPVAPMNGTHPPHYENGNADVDRRFLLGKLRKFTETMNAAGDGSRHGVRLDLARAAAGYIHTGHITETDVWEALAVNFGPDQANAEKTIRDGIAYGLANPLAYERPAYEHKQPAPIRGPVTRDATGKALNGTAPERHVSGPPQFSFTDTGNAERMIQHCIGDLRYSYQLQAWFIWDGTRWQMDENGSIERLALSAVRSIVENNGDKEALKWALKSLSNRSIKDMIERARPLVSVMLSDFDSDPWLLNCKNGTLDLRSGELRPHSRADLITKSTSCDYDPWATCPHFEAAILKIMGGDEKLVEFLQKAIGYSLSGDTREQCIFILHGIGSNGKSTLLELFSDLLSDYGMNCPSDTFIQKKGDEGISNDIARLRGARFVSAVETGEEKHLNEPLVKRMTGQDTITARFLRKEFFQFRPQFKVFLATNHRPVIRGNDDGIWRRIHLVPFNVRFWNPDKGEDGPDELCIDKELSVRLRAELPGILAWCVRGCTAWQKRALPAPEKIKDNTSEYRRAMDVLGAFIEDECEVGEDRKETSNALYGAYSRWCKANGEDVLSQKALAQRLEERGFVSRRANNYRFWKGVSLCARPENTQDND